MNVSSFDLNHARALHHLVEEAHVARAAKRLGITPAAASNALRRLRVEFADELLVRQGRTLMRTPLAEPLRLPARELLLAAQQLVTASARFEPRTYEGTFELATSDAIATVLLPKLHERFATHLPRASLKVRAVPIEMVTALRGAIGVAVTPVAKHDAAVVTEDLFTETSVCVLRRGHPLLRGPWSAKRVAAVAQIAIESAASSQVDDAFAARGLPRHVTRVVPTFALATPLLLASDAIAIVPTMVARAATSRGLIARPAPFALPSTLIKLAWHLRHTADPRHVFFRRLVREATP